MKLKCTDCDLQIECAEHDEVAFEHSKCLDPECHGRFKFYKATLPMVGDPIEADTRTGYASHRNFDRQKVIYRHIMDQKHGVVPECLRVGLWYHW